MEEDIKILEDMITWDCTLPNKRQTEALENLLTRYNQLEEENKHYKKYALMMTTEGLIINGVKFNISDYLTKSKVEEILNKEKLPLTIVGGRRNAKTLEYGRKLGRIEACKELLEEE